MLRLAALLSALFVIGCGAAQRPPESAREAREAYASALESGDAAALRAREPEPRQERRDEAALAVLVADARGELAALGAALRAAPEAATVSRARIWLAGGRIVWLVHEDGAWRIDGGVLGSPALRAPADAIDALRRALLEHDLPGIESVLSRETLAAWRAEARRVTDSTSERAALDVRVEGERATVHAPGGVVIELVLEAGEWRVSDIH